MNSDNVIKTIEKEIAALIAELDNMDKDPFCKDDEWFKGERQASSDILSRIGALKTLPDPEE